MSKEEILEGNILIAKFMKFYFRDDICQPIRGWITGLETMTYNPETYLKFHSSWDWLIPVIDKIYSMNEYIEYKDYMNNIICDGGIDINTKFIQITFSDAVEFIKWYNKSK